jgi:lipoprotein LprG
VIDLDFVRRQLPPLRAHRWRWTLANLAAGLAMLIAACGSGDSFPDARKVVASATVNMNQVRAVHFVLGLEETPIEIMPGLNVTRAEGDVVRPDRMQAKLQAKALGMVISVNVRAVEGVQYVTNPIAPDQWQALPTPAVAGSLLDPQIGVTAILSGLVDAKVVGQDSLDGIDAWRITATADNQLVAPFFQSEPASGNTAVETWIGTSDFLVYKVILTGPTVVGDSDNVQRTIEFSRFGEVVEIAPPA